MADLLKLAPIPEQQPLVNQGRIDGNWLRWLRDLKQRVESAVLNGGGAIDASQIATGTIDLARIANLTNAQIANAAAIAWAKINKAGSSLADLTTRSAADLSSGTLPDARFPATLPAISGANLTNLDASDLASGTVPDGRFPATLPAASGANLTNLDASDLATGTVADARLSANVPLINAANVFTANQRVNAGVGVNVAPGATGEIKTSAGIYERGRSVANGEWSNVAFDSGNFTASGSMTWTLASGDQIGFSYVMPSGHTMIVAAMLETTTVGGTPSFELRVTLPNGAVCARNQVQPCYVLDNGVHSPEAFVQATTGNSYLLIRKSLAAPNFAASTDNTTVYFNIPIEIQ